MQLRVDRDLCEANGVCTGVAPEVFELDDDEQLQILQPDPPADQLDRVRKAVERCPKAALMLAEEPA
jgi:ferredoxin